MNYIDHERQICIEIYGSDEEGYGVRVIDFEGEITKVTHQQTLQEADFTQGDIEEVMMQAFRERFMNQLGSKFYNSFLHDKGKEE